ncbi:MAG: DUF262 domain-containing protein [Bacteroidales bacterium]|nr:DUF262 domain-containing protein [Bacteroidales bacterium]MDD6782045.1 DUF262 domain-containing protein [Bacteroidales bacterium]
MSEKYSVNQFTVEQILNFIKSDEIAIPEIQRPFVWKGKQVRDLVDSLYKGYPTGYIIISKSPDLKLKDGTTAVGKKIMIDGQQRVTAMMTALSGLEVFNADFEKKHIAIAYNPFAKNDEECFAVQDNAILKDKKWIPDISVIFQTTFDSFSFVQDFCEVNPEITPKEFNQQIQKLFDIKNRKLGVIELFDKELSIDEVTEIFIRINSQGTKLNQADFAMSRIAANESYGGNMLRKAIDYFSHLAVDPKWYQEMTKDEAFSETDYAPKLKWLKDDNDDIYNPDYSDMLRVAFMSQYPRGKMKDLVSLLQGRDFETKDFKESIAEETFKKLSAGVLDYMNEYNFKQFVLAIKDAGFISKKLITSDITLDFAYTLYLRLLKDNTIDKTKVKSYVQRWYVMSTLTGRYISSPESAMDLDLRRLKEKSFLPWLDEVEKTLGDTFWNVELVQNLETSSVNSPYLCVFWAACCRDGSDSLFNEGSKFANLITTMGDVHHIFPKQYLIDNGIKDKAKYNQVANFTYLDTPTNIAIGKDEPSKYFTKVWEQVKTSDFFIGNLKTEDAIEKNLSANCIPLEIKNWIYTNYENFLSQRRILMANKIKNYYYSL